MLGLVGVDIVPPELCWRPLQSAEPHRHQGGRTGNGDPSHVQVSRHTVAGRNSGTGRPRHDRRQVEAMNLLMAAATSAGCSSATQCPLSAMMLVATYRVPA